MSSTSIDPRAVKAQYQASNNLEARIRIHRLFSTNTYGWYRWYLDQVSLFTGARILELGCGPGSLWKDQLDRLPAGARLALTDYSRGMVRQARANLSDRRISFASADAQSIPFPNASFDVVIANHMLYHVPDRDRAIREIRRVLAPGGRLYAATNGLRHMAEIEKYSRRLTARYADEQTGEQVSLWTKAFTLENGGGQLARHFTTVRMERYPDGLRVTGARPLVEYVLSLLANFQRNIPAEEVERFTRELDEEIQASGCITITKDTGVFIAT